jgi:hypothetical protein
VLLKSYAPPGNLKDFDAIPGQLEHWSAAVSGWFDGNIALVEETLKQRSQFYNATKTEVPGAPVDQTIPWAALPGTLRNRWGREMALDLAEQLVPIAQRMDGPGQYQAGAQWLNLFYRPQDEYCEWRVTRDEDGRILRVTFTSEPPEYWQALHGDTLSDVSEQPKYPFEGDKQLLLELYRELVSPAVQLPELECTTDLLDYSDPSKPVVVYPKGSYNPYNRWNTTAGIVHLTHHANSLAAEINLAAQASILREVDGRPLIDPEALISGAAFGGPNRSSDPTIGSSVNELAALGAYVTIRDPVGLSMHHLNLQGFETPGGEPVDQSFFRVLRGSATDGLIERAVFEVPAGEGYLVSDLRIGGIPITRGSQIAEHIVVNIVGRASGLSSFHTSPVPCRSSACQDNLQGNWLRYAPVPDAIARPAFEYPPATPAAAAADEPSSSASLAAAARRDDAPPMLTAHRRMTRHV